MREDGGFNALNAETGIGKNFVFEKMYVRFLVLPDSPIFGGIFKLFLHDIFKDKANPKI